MAKELLTLREAQQLRQRFLSLIEERDKLGQALEEHKLILAEFETLRAFLGEAPAGAMAVNGASNGHLAARDQGSTALPTQAEAADVTAPDPDPAEVERDATGADLQAEAEMSPGIVNAEVQRHPGETPVDDRRNEPNSDESGGGNARPPAGTLMARILGLIEQSDRPKRPWQVQKELNLSRMPSAELSRLVAMGWLTRPKEGIYAIPGRDYGGSVSTEGVNS
jgi:hypothetical protein